MGPIEVRYLLNDAEALTAVDQLRRVSTPAGPRLLRLATGFGGLFLAAWEFAIAFIVPGGRSAGGEIAMLVGALIGLVFFILPLRMWSVSRKQAMKSAHPETTLSWTIDGDRVHYVSPFVDARMAWGAYLKIVRTSKGFLLFRGPGQASWLPLHGFTAPDGPERFATLARDRVRNFQVEGIGGRRPSPQAATMFDPTDRS